MQGRWAPNMAGPVASLLLLLIGLTVPGPFAMTAAWAQAEPPTSDRPEPAPTPTPVGPPGTLQPATGGTPPRPTIPGGPVIPFPISREEAGIPRAFMELRPSITLSEEYTDNFNQNGGRTENFRTAVTPGATLFINGAFLKGSIGANVSETYDTSTDDFNFFYSLNGSVTWEATPRFRLIATDTLTRSDSSSEADRLNIRQGRQKFTSNVFSVTGEYQIGTIVTQAHYILGMFLNDGGDDTISHTIGVGVTIPIYTINRLALGYEYLTSQTSGGAGDNSGHTLTATYSRDLGPTTTAGVTTSYSFNRTTSDTTDNDFRIWTVSLFANYSAPRWAVSASVGYTRLDSDAGNNDDSIFTASTLSYRLARGSVGVSVEQGFSQTFATGENRGVVKTRGITGFVTWAFTPRLTTNAQAFFRQTESTGVGGGTTTGDQENWGGSLALQLQLLRFLTMGLDYTYSNRSQVGPGGNFEENRGRVFFTASF